MARTEIQTRQARWFLKPDQQKRSDDEREVAKRAGGHYVRGDQFNTQARVMSSPDSHACICTAAVKPPARPL
jgi:hypothetical protein